MTGYINILFSQKPLDTGRKLNVHKVFRRRPERLMYVQFLSYFQTGGKVFKVEIEYRKSLDNFLYGRAEVISYIGFSFPFNQDMYESRETM